MVEYRQTGPTWRALFYTPRRLFRSRVSRRPHCGEALDIDRLSEVKARSRFGPTAVFPACPSVRACSRPGLTVARGAAMSPPGARAPLGSVAWSGKRRWQWAGGSAARGQGQRADAPT
jgi:hypothetical protein